MEPGRQAGRTWRHGGIEARRRGEAGHGTGTGGGVTAMAPCTAALGPWVRAALSDSQPAARPNCNNRPGKLRSFLCDDREPRCSAAAAAGRPRAYMQPASPGPSSSLPAAPRCSTCPLHLPSPSPSPSPSACRFPPTPPSPSCDEPHTTAFPARHGPP